MAFDTVTFFEVHVDGLPTGATGGEPADAAETVEAETSAAESTSGNGRKVAYLAMIALATAVSFVARRRRRADSGGEGIDMDAADGETVDTESASVSA